MGIPGRLLRSTVHEAEPLSRLAPFRFALCLRSACRAPVLTRSPRQYECEKFLLHMPAARLMRREEPLRGGELFLLSQNASVAAGRVPASSWIPECQVKDLIVRKQQSGVTKSLFFP